MPNKQELLRLVARYALVPLDDAQEAPFDLLLRLRRTLLSLRDGADLVLIAYALDAELPPVPGLTAALEAEGADADSAAEVAAVLMRCALGAVAVEQNASLFGTADEDRSAKLYEHAMRSVLSGS
ncbi:hypothetical protein [Nesterenkonia pannonica]|uniref:hypothetical protein n=1 Tax=Nesterenkonia pannonica TaxID=1548602 RepID=UPI002164106C|nr:hypothetical protein [Nesterenkonia pannonica]